MKKTLLLTLAAFAVSTGYSQNDKFWSAYKGDSSKIATDKSVTRISFPKQFDLYELNLNHIKQTLLGTLNRLPDQKVIITLPNADGGLEQFEMYEASNFVPELQAQFPEIRAYSGRGISDKYATLKLSISPQGIQTMVFRTDKENEFIEPYSQDHRVYAVFKSQREKGKLPWTCSVNDNEMFAEVTPKANKAAGRFNDGTLRTMRLAQSVTAEYSNYFGATSSAQVGLVLTAINNTLTRCNGVYEKDLGLHLNLIAESTNVIYYNPATDPYSAAGTGAGGAWNAELQNTLSSSLAGPSTSLATNNALYDIGHLFGASGGGGNAGCIGCVCVDDTASTSDKNKGSGYTSPADGIPSGDNFDIDYVVHEVGHQLGGNHTFSHGNEGTGVNMEVGSGVTIMGYAGITAQDVAPHSIDVYHAASIFQIQANLSGKTCPVSTTITANNATPNAIGGADYTIPKSTPFMLTGAATDANAGDALTYSWEQYDNASGAQTGASSAASETKATGPNWRSYSQTSSPVRYFPKLSTILANQLTTAGTDIAVEALSSVARTLNFRLTVRDNVPYSSTAPIKVGQTDFDDVVVTVDGTRGPLTITSQGTTGISWNQGSTQTITWTVNGTNTSTGGANVDILLSTDGGQTFGTTLLANTPNDGSENITVPNIAFPYCRIMIKASNSIFFNVNSKDFAIGYTVTNTCNTYTDSTPLPFIDQAPGNYTTRTLNVPTTANIGSVNVFNKITHTYLSDVQTDISSPANPTTFVKLFNRSCGSTNGAVNLKFSDGGAGINCTAGGTTLQTVAPGMPLSAFNGQNPNGVWTFRVYDNYGGDTGTVNTWGIEICSQTITLTTETFGLENFTLYPNPNNGNFNVQFNPNSGNDVKINVHDMRGRLVFEKNYQNSGMFNQNIQLNNVQSGIYMVTVQNGDRKEVKKISIN